MTQNGSKWILNTTFKKMTFFKIFDPPSPPKMTNVIFFFFFNEGFPKQNIFASFKL